MAYFSNGTEGMDYEERYCSKCVHHNGIDGKSGCPVWLAHLLFAYEECNSKSNAKSILDILIPMNKDNFADECQMFHEGQPVPELTTKSEVKPAVMPSMAGWAKARGIIS